MEGISVETQLGWYRQMCLIRAFEREVYQLNTAGVVRGTAHLYIGMEAIAVGACTALREDDLLTSTHRGHGHCIGCNLDLGRMMAEILGRADGTCGGKGGSMHIADISRGMLGADGIVGGGIPIAVFNLKVPSRIGGPFIASINTSRRLPAGMEATSEIVFRSSPSCLIMKPVVVK